MYSSITKVNQPDFYIEGIASFLELKTTDYTKNEDSILVSINHEKVWAFFDTKTLSYNLSYTFPKSDTYKIYTEYLGVNKKIDIRLIPLIFSIFPPIAILIFVFLFKEVISSLFIGLLTGSLLLFFYNNPSLYTFVSAFLKVIDHYVIDTFKSESHISIIVFTMLIGATVSLMSNNGGMKGMVRLISRYANTRKKSLFSVWLMGIVIFFDDYANVMIVGKTMGKLTKKYSVSKEKLSYIVDSTAAPIAAIGLITTWIGSILGYINDGVSGYEQINEGSYAIFMKALPYAFYPLLTMVFVFFIIYLGRDYGPMYHVERKLLLKTTKQNVNSQSFIMSNRDVFLKGFLPILIILLGTIIGLFITGYDSKVWGENVSLMRKISITIGNSDSYVVLIWTSTIALIVSLLTTSFTKTCTIKTSMDYVIEGFKEMLPSVTILILAWALSDITKDMHTAVYISRLIEGFEYLELLPAIMFIIAALVSFSTGSSWGAMAILYSIFIPVILNLILDVPNFENMIHIFYISIASILSGCVFGDHCSPISDTTILSSMSTNCDHIAHVKTQIPYALTVGLIAVCLGFIPSGYGIPFWVCLPVSGTVAILMIRFLGKKIEL